MMISTNNYFSAVFNSLIISWMYLKS